jgi:uncharacterized protein (DUF952 family)
MLLTDTIVIIALKSAWQKARAAGQYTQSTIDKTLAEVGFIHGSFPPQTMEIANRRYAKNEDLVILLIDPSRVTSPVKYEGARSGRPGTFPHIYGPLNTDAVYSVLQLKKDKNGQFINPVELSV